MDPSSPVSPAADAGSGDGPPEQAAAARQPVQANFLQFLSGLAIQALMHLGQVARPGTDRREVDLPNARYSIDLLGVMEEKTKGNLTPDEAKYLAAVLRDLRLEYIQKASPDAAPRDGAASN